MPEAFLFPKTVTYYSPPRQKVEAKKTSSIKSRTFYLNLIARDNRRKKVTG